jgi:hypothetical protein
MWKVGEERTVLVGCNPESNFPISIELKFSVSKDRHHDAENSHGMWFGVEDAQRLILQLEQAIETVRAAEQKDAPCPHCGRVDGGHHLSLHPYPPSAPAAEEAPQ